MTERENGVDEILKAYSERINNTPTLVSLLYDADMLPEQIVSRRGAISVAAVVEAYFAGLRDCAKQNDSGTESS